MWPIIQLTMKIFESRKSLHKYLTLGHHSLLTSKYLFVMTDELELIAVHHKKDPKMLILESK